MRRKGDSVLRIPRAAMHAGFDDYLAIADGQLYYIETRRPAVDRMGHICAARKSVHANAG